MNSTSPEAPGDDESGISESESFRFSPDNRGKAHPGHGAVPVNIHGAAFPFVSLRFLVQKCPKLKTRKGLFFFFPFFGLFFVHYIRIRILINLPLKFKLWPQYFGVAELGMFLGSSTPDRTRALLGH